MPSHGHYPLLPVNLPRLQCYHWQWIFALQSHDPCHLAFDPRSFENSDAPHTHRRPHQETSMKKTPDEVSGDQIRDDSLYH